MKTLLFPCAVLAAVAGHADDVLLVTPGYQGNRWGTAAIWRSGTIPGGAGTVIDTGDGSREVRMDPTNRVVGAITTTTGTMPADGGDFLLSNANDGDRYSDPLAPQNIVDVSARNPTNALVFANNGESARISIGDGGTGATKRRPFRHLYDVPVKLEDNLLVEHRFAGADAYGHYTTGSHAGPAAGVVFSQAISGEGRSITVDNAASTLGVVFMGENTFTGDLVSRKGIVRAKDTVNLPRVGTPFGRDNTVVAVTEGSGVDLGGFITGEGQTLRLRGRRTDGGRDNGVLFSSWAKPGASAEWRGAVSLEGDTWIGGTIAGTGWPANFYPWDSAGNLTITGDITEKTPSALHVTGCAFTRLEGSNAFSGGLALDEGYFTAGSPASFGTGGITFNGGTYCYSSNDDANVLEADITGGTDWVRLYVADGVTAPIVDNPVFVSKPNLYAFGPGTLVLTNCVNAQTFLRGNTVVFDTSVGGVAKFGKPDAVWMMSMSHAYDNCRFIARGDPAKPGTGAWYGTPNDGCALTFRSEDNQQLYFSFNNPINVLGYVNFETDGSGAWFKFETPTTEHDYVNNFPYFVWDGRSFCRTESNRLGPVPDANYASSWAGAEARAVDVTPVLAADPVPAGTVADVVRIGSSNPGEELVLTLAGDLKLKNNTLLISADVKGDVRITGGAIKTSNIIRIINHNTNGVVTIESDLAVGDNANTQVAFCGPGKTVLSGEKTFNGMVYIVGGEVEVGHPHALGKGNAAWNSGYVWLSNDAILSFAASMDPAAGATNGRGEFTVKISSTGGALKVKNPEDTVTFSRNGILLHNGGRFRKLGPGRLVQNGNNAVVQNVVSGDSFFKWPYARTEYLEGSCEHGTNFPQDPGVLAVGNGVTLVGYRWLSANQAGAGGGGSRFETQAKRQLLVGPGGATIDLAGSVGNLTLTDISAFYGIDKCPEFFQGTGDLTIRDTVSADSKINGNGYADFGYAGRLTSYVPFVTQGGLTFAKAEFNVPSGVEHRFTQVSEPHHPLRFGRLSGAGTLYAQAIQTTVPGIFYLGQDDAEGVADFSGELKLDWGSNTMNALQLVKVGNNAQRISGASNMFRGNTIVRAGSLLVGNDSPATADVGGALGKAMVYVGDAATPGDATPALLADGAYAIANEIRVHATSPKAALPTIGGTANANGATFSGKVTLYRDAAFTAGEGATVTFTGAIDTQGHAIAKTGAGEVVLTGDLALDAGYSWAGGTLKTTGAAACAGPLAIDASHLPATEKGQTYRCALLSAAGGITGKFDDAALPEGWRLRYTATGVELLWSDTGFTVFVR